MCAARGQNVHLIRFLIENYFIDLEHKSSVFTFVFYNIILRKDIL